MLSEASKNKITMVMGFTIDLCGIENCQKYSPAHYAEQYLAGLLGMM